MQAGGRTALPFPTVKGAAHSLLIQVMDFFDSVLPLTSKLIYNLFQELSILQSYLSCDVSFFLELNLDGGPD